MIAFIRRIWSAAPIATVLFGLALLTAGVFSLRLAASWVYWNDPAHRDQVIEPWMTPHYIAMSWHVPREVMIEALETDANDGHPTPIERLANQRGVPVEDLIAEIQAAIAVFRATTPGPWGEE